MAELRTPQGHTLLLPGGGVGIGTDPSNEVQVAAHLGLAAVHFRLRPWEGGHFIEDAGSGLGTLVNGHPVNWKPLSHGDVITAGELEVVYVQQHSPANNMVPVAVVPPVPAVPGFPPLEPTVPSPGRAISPPTPAFPVSLEQLLPSLKPPAWLPEDLWPEVPGAALETLPAPPPVGGHPWEEVVWPVDVLTSPQPFSSFSSAGASAGASLPASEKLGGPVPRRRRILKRWVAVASCLLLLAGMGHVAWQQGYLARWIPALQPGNQPSPAVPVPPAAAPASGVATPAVPSVPAKPLPPVPAKDPRVANQSPP